MIPKIIHYCWLSKDRFPSKIAYCINSWKKIIPDYEFVLWDWDKCKEENILNDWVVEAFNNKKYAFACDYIRLYAVYKYGGIYLDSDVEVIRRFDSLLHLPYFIGREAVGERVEIAAFGAQKEMKWIKLCLDYYKNRHFIKKDGSLDERVMPDIINESISATYIINNIDSIDSFEYNQNYFNQFPRDWFCANVYKNPEDLKPSYAITNETYCIHHFANSWIDRGTLIGRIKGIIKHIFYNSKL